MRLPFGLGRRSSSGDGAAGGGSGSPSVSGSGASRGAPAGQTAPSRAWASLPPIQRTAGSMPLVAAPARFAGGLPGSNALPPIVQSLGHEVSSLATPGLVVARTRPIEVAAAGAMPAPVQRRASRSSQPAAATVADPGPAPEGIEHIAHADEGPTPVAATPAAAPASPIRSMPTVSRLSVRMPERPLTSAALAARPAAVQRAAAAAAAADAPATPATPAPSGGMRRVPSSGMPLAKPTVSRQASSFPAEPAAQPTRAASGPSRSGLGEPMTSLPASARPVASPGPVISRSTTGPMQIAASSLRAPVQRTASAAPSGAQGSSGPTPTLANLPALPHLPVARASGSAPISGTSADGAFASPAPVVQTSHAPASPQIRPIAGANPIRTSIGLQREAADDLDDDSGDDDSALPSPWWSSGDAASNGPTGLGLDGPATSIQRSRANAGTSAMAPAFGAPSRAAAQPNPSLPARASVQRIAAPSGRSSQPMPPLPAPVGSGSHTRSGHEASPAGHSSSTHSGGTAPSVQTSLMAATPPLAASFGNLGPGPAIQREGGNVAMKPDTPTPPATGPAGSPGAAGQIAPSGPASSGHSEKELDELAQALFGRIRGRLRSDLIYDREAKGLTFDNV